jgi:hypothetical protein
MDAVRFDIDLFVPLRVRGHRRIFLTRLAVQYGFAFLSAFASLRLINYGFPGVMAPWRLI